MNKRKSRPTPVKNDPLGHFDFPLDTQNLKLVGVGAAFILLGFIVMALGADDIYSFTKITLSVILIMFGFLFEIYAIMKPKATDRPPSSEDNTSSAEDA